MDSNHSANSATRAVIIGAGRGSRLGHHTEDRPKCLLDGLGGKRLLDWLLDAYHQAGVERVSFVAGYRADMIQSAYPQLQYFLNDKWADNNVLESLLYARPVLEDGCVVSYADVLWRPAIVQKLVETPGDIVLVVDRDWRHRYVGRTAHPTSEAEKTITRDGRVIKIGKVVPVDYADGEFAGLAHFTRKGMQSFLAVYDEVRKRPDRPLQAARSLAGAYLTDLLQELIDRGVEVRVVETWGGWVEIDTSEDLEMGREMLTEEGLDGVAREFWAVRAKRYESLEWARRNDYLKSVVDSGSFAPTDHVLEVGTGTGVVAHAIAPFVADMTGIDISDDMLEQAKKNRAQNERFEVGTLRHLQFPDGTFDKVVARMVFHHIMPDPVVGLRECYRVLKPGGLMVLSEGVPPDESVRQWYSDMFALKEERLTFMEDDLTGMLTEAGFSVTRVVRHVSKQVSIGNWLRSSGLPEDVQKQIHQLHLDLHDRGKQAYNMTSDADDIRCDFHFVTAVGQKPVGVPS